MGWESSDDGEVSADNIQQNTDEADQQPNIATSNNDTKVILRSLHFAKNPNDGEPKPADRLYKIRPIINFFNERMEQIHYPDKQLSLDQSMVSWRGRLGFKQSLKNKKLKCGMKLYMLTNPTGLIQKFAVYTDPTQEPDVVNVTENLSLNLECPELLHSAPELDISTTEIISQIETANEPTPSCSSLQKTFSPSKIRPLPKAPPRKTNTNSRRKKKSTVLTDTPEKEALQKEYEEEMKKKQKKYDKIKGKGKGKEERKGKGKSTKNKTGVDRAKKKILCSDSESESEEWYCLKGSDLKTFLNSKRSENENNEMITKTDKNFESSAVDQSLRS
ncbi:hypothetical protein JTB14_035608 [Gonioctena quinquepunctata]|nr:hypothetical protein JTB14_035608 [Gonioctena quinquepunctata]